MEKLLTVSVAAYNGAATLQKALESCLVADTFRPTSWWRMKACRRCWM